MYFYKSFYLLKMFFVLVPVCVIKCQFLNYYNVYITDNKCTQF